MSPLSKVTDPAHSQVIVSILDLLSVSIDLFDEGDGGKGIHGHYQWISLCVVPSCNRTTSSSIDRFMGNPYELTWMVAAGGHNLLMFWTATW